MTTKVVERVRAHFDSVSAVINAIAIDTRLKVVDAAAVQELWFRTDPPDKAMLLTAWGNSSLDPVGIFPATHRSGGRGNSSRYANPELDELLDTAAVELDRERRAGLCRQAEAIANREVPYIYLWMEKEIHGLSERVSGWRPRPDGRMNLHDVCFDDEPSSELGARATTPRSQLQADV